MHRKALKVVEKELGVYVGRVQGNGVSGRNRTCVGMTAAWERRERSTNALFEGWAKKTRAYNQVSLMYQLSVNAEAKKDKDIHTLLDR